MDTGLDPDAVIESVNRVAIAESRLRPQTADIAVPLNGELAKLISPGCGGMLATESASGSDTQVNPMNSPTQLPEVLGAGVPA